MPAPARTCEQIGSPRNPDSLQCPTSGSGKGKSERGGQRTRISLLPKKASKSFRNACPISWPRAGRAVPPTGAFCALDPTGSARPPRGRVRGRREGGVGDGEARRPGWKVLEGPEGGRARFWGRIGGGKDEGSCCVGESRRPGGRREGRLRSAHGPHLAWPERSGPLDANAMPDRAIWTVRLLATLARRPLWPIFN